MVFHAIRRFYIRLAGLLSKGADSVKLSLAGALLGALGWLGLTLSLQRIAGVAELILAEGLIVFVQTLLVLAVIRKLDDLARRRVHDERAMQATVALYLALRPERPLPYLRSAALGTDSCLEYVRLIKHLQPNTIVELGSGSSAVIAGYQLKQNGRGRVIAVDHDEYWGELTRDALLEHELTDVADVRIASLKPVNLDGHQYHWYDLSELQDLASIDILLIDGPPDAADLGLRYPGLELLFDRISSAGVILMDDCVMPRWNRTVLEWATRRAFTVSRLPLNEKNTLLLRRPRDAQENDPDRQRQAPMQRVPHRGVEAHQ